MKLTTIYGRAGCGKTTKLVELIKSCKKYVVLAPTNAAIENIFKMVGNGKREKFKTIYSFFRIDYENDLVLGMITPVETIFIDEFGLINKSLFKKCYKDAEAKGCKHIIMTGDVMQLNPIYLTKQCISFNKLKWWYGVWERLKKSFALSPSVIEHVHLNVFGTKLVRSSELVPLSVNFRSSGYVKDVLNHVYSGDANFAYNFAEFYDIPKMIENDGFTFIASKYSILQRMFDNLAEYWKAIGRDYVTFTQCVGKSLTYKKLYLYPGMKLVICDTKKDKYINGQEVIYTGNMDADCLNCVDALTGEMIQVQRSSDAYGNAFYPVTPSQLLTVHKSQGRTIKNVIVCVDDVFDMCMLYTAITRAQEGLCFYSKVDMKKRVQTLLNAARINEFKQLNKLVEQLSNVTPSHDECET